MIFFTLALDGLVAQSYLGIIKV